MKDEGDWSYFWYGPGMNVDDTAPISHSWMNDGWAAAQRKIPDEWEMTLDERDCFILRRRDKPLLIIFIRRKERSE